MRQLKKLAWYFIFQIVALCLQPVTAQFIPTEVVRSGEKTLVDGKIYYIHTVLKGQTSYSISKTYEVTVEEIKNANPEVDVMNLAEGIALKIPDSKSRQAIAYPQNKEDFISHVVKKSQTVYSLAKKYKVDKEVIYHYNPWAREGIKEDQTLWIPKKKEMREVANITDDNDRYYFYTAREKDTLYSIAKDYGVSVADIVEANPELRNGLKQGQVLKIPKLQRLVPEQDTSMDTLPENQPCVPLESTESYTVALMLPFFAAFNVEEMEIPEDSIAEEGVYIPQQRQQGLRGKSFAEFYEGFLLAVDSLKSTGFSVNLRVYDTERDTLKTKKIVQEIAQIQPDLIIGPVYSEDVAIAGRYARHANTCLVSPLSTRTHLVNNNPDIIQVIPSRQSESYAIANYLRTFNKGRIILIRGIDSVSMNNSWRFKNYLQNNMPRNESGNPLYFKDYKLNDSLKRDVSKILSKEEENLIVVFSENEPDVNILITRLIQRSSVYPIVVLGMPSWQSWTNIDLNFFHSLQLRLVTPFYTDYSNPQVRNFLRRSRSVYGYEPFEISPLGYNFSMLGYDVGFYFLSALRQYGKNFQSCIDQVNAEQLLTRFHFVYSGSGGLINNGFNVIHYRSDFTIEKTTVVYGESENPSVNSITGDSTGTKVLIP